MRQVMSTALVAVIVGAVSGATMGALAQSEPATERAVTPAAGINAASVDGKSAVGFTNKRGPRRGKLVATNRQGELPSNIVRPYWGFIKNKPGSPRRPCHRLERSPRHPRELRRWSGRQGYGALEYPASHWAEEDGRRRKDGSGASGMS